MHADIFVQICENCKASFFTKHAPLSESVDFNNTTVFKR